MEEQTCVKDGGVREHFLKELDHSYSISNWKPELRITDLFLPSRVSIANNIFLEYLAWPNQVGKRILSLSLCVYIWTRVVCSDVCVLAWHQATRALFLYRFFSYTTFTVSFFSSSVVQSGFSWVIPSLSLWVCRISSQPTSVSFSSRPPIKVSVLWCSFFVVCHIQHADFSFYWKSDIY